MPFRLLNWSAWAPGLTSADDWLRWAEGVGTTEGLAEPGAKTVPPMLRRRAERLGKMALEVLGAIGDRDQPLIYCSRHGETARSVQLLRQLAREGAVSPQSFSMAVHNATAGLHTIAGASHVSATAIAAGRDTAFAGLIEALGQLNDGAESVLLLCVDEPLPPVYQRFADGAEPSFAFVLEIGHGEQFVVETTDAGDSAEPLELLRFVLNPPTPPLALKRGWQLCRSGQ